MCARWFSDWRWSAAALVALAAAGCGLDDSLKASDYGITAPDKGAVVVKDSASGFTIRKVTPIDETKKETSYIAIPDDRHMAYQVEPGRYQVRVNYYGTSGTSMIRDVCNANALTQISVRSGRAVLVEMKQNGPCSMMYKPPSLITTERISTAAASPQPTVDFLRAGEYGVTEEDRAAIVVKDNAQDFYIQQVFVIDKGTGSKETFGALPDDSQQVYPVMPGEYNVLVYYFGTSPGPFSSTIKCEGDAGAIFAIGAADAVLLELEQSGGCSQVYTEPRLNIITRHDPRHPAPAAQ